MTLQDNLSKEVQGVAIEAASLRERLDSSNEYVLRLSRDLNATREEVRQLAGELAHVWSTEIGGGSAIRTELRNQIAGHVQQLGHELRAEISGHKDMTLHAATSGDHQWKASAQPRSEVGIDLDTKSEVKCAGS